MSDEERERLSPEEISALFAPEGEEPDEDDLEATPGGLPPDLFGLLEGLARRTFFAAFEDLDDFLETSVELGEVAVAASRGQELARVAEGGASLEVRLQGAPGGRGWYALGEAAARRFLGAVLDSAEGEVSGELGPLHEAALEGPTDELASCLARHLGDAGLGARVGAGSARLGAPDLDPDTHLLELETTVTMGDAELSVFLFLEEELSRALGDHARAEAPEPAADAAPPAVEVPEGRALAVLGAVTASSLELRPGVVLPLDRLAGDLVEIRVGGRVVAEGQVVVHEDHYAVRVERRVGGPSGGDGEGAS